MSGLAIAPGFSLPLSLVTEPIGVLANRGRGKSSTTRVLVEEMHDAGQPVVILDVKGDWWGIRSSAAGGKDGYPFFIFGGDHGDLPLEPTAGELIADLVVDERVSVVLDMSLISKTKARSFTTSFAERLYHRNRDPLFLVVDEADVLIPQRASAETARLLGAMEDLAKRGRGRGLGIAVVTQRPQEVAKSVLDLMDTLILMGMTGPRSIKAVKDWISVHVDEDTTAEEVIASLPGFDIGEAWVWSPMQHLLKRIKVRRIRTFDSHATPQLGATRQVPRGRSAVDIAALGARITATVERAKADDPRTLRARIVELERDLAKERAAPPPQPVIERVEVSVLTDEDRAVVEQVMERWDRAYDDAASTVNLLHDALTRVAYATRLNLPQPAATERKSAQERAAVRTAPRTAPQATAPRTAPQPSVEQSTDDVHLKAGARRILETLARHHPMRVTRSQLGTLAKFKITGGTFLTYWSVLKRHGLVDESGGDIGITQAGLDHVGVHVGQPLTTDELLAQWRTALKAGARQMLDALVAIYPRGMDREQLAAAVEMTASGGTFQTYLSTLRRNGLIDITDGQVTASASLFLSGAS